MNLSVRPRFATALLVILLPALLAGCSLLPEQDPVRLFTLPEPALSESPDTTRELTLRIDTPGAGSPLNGRRLLVMPTPGEFQTYPGARWRDDAPPLLRDQLLAAFRLDGRLGAVVDNSSSARSDAILASDLNAFHTHYREGHPEVVVRLHVRLIDATSREVLASRRLETMVASENESLAAVVDAFRRATDRLAGELVDWTVSQLGPP